MSLNRGFAGVGLARGHAAWISHFATSSGSGILGIRNFMHNEGLSSNARCSRPVILGRGHGVSPLQPRFCSEQYNGAATTSPSMPCSPAPVHADADLWLHIVYVLADTVTVIFSLSRKNHTPQATVMRPDPIDMDRGSRNLPRLHAEPQ